MSYKAHVVDCYADGITTVPVITHLSMKKHNLLKTFNNRVRNLFSMPVSSGRDNAIDGLRGVAVLLTFLVHFNGLYLVMFRGGNPDAIPFFSWSAPFDKLLFWLYHSHHGVYIFFILSGFLICRITVRSNRSFAYATFLKRRFMRIYPAFLLTLSICLGISVLLFGSAVPSVEAICGNLLFLNALPVTGTPPLIFNNVTWSLFYEVCFYLVFPIVAIAARHYGKPPALILVIGGFLAAYGPLAFGIYTEFFLLFFAGALVGIVDPRQARILSHRIPDELLVIVYFLLTTSYALGLIDVSRFMLWFSAAGALIVLKAAYGHGFITRALAWQPLVWLGGISYSFYLLHCVPLFLIINYLPLRSLQPGPIHAAVLASLSLAGTVALAAISFALTERPYFRQSHTAFGGDLQHSADSLNTLGGLS